MKSNSMGPWLAKMTLLAALLGGCTVSNPWMKADRLFKAEEYPQAAEAYNQAAERYPHRREPVFNCGAAHYMAGDLDAAMDSFADVAKQAGDELQERSEFNIGNTYLRKGDREQAIEHYKRALYLKHDDINAKWNLELAQQQQQQQEQQQQDQDEPKRPPDEQQNQDQQQPEQPQYQQPQPQQDERELSQREAERLLRALAEQDKELQKSLRKPTEPILPTPHGKDW